MVRFEPFLLDRLLGAAGGDRADGARPGLSLHQLKDTVARDLEALLNTRSAWLPEAMRSTPHAAGSVMTYGLRDFVGMSLDNPDDRERICSGIADAIARHEPRLKSVRVQLVDRSSVGLGLRFAIHAQLVVNPAQEPVSFNALLQPSTQRYAVTQANLVRERMALHG